MALSSMGVVSAGLNNLQRSSEGIVQPLDAIEARRAARAKEMQEQQKADAASMKAAAQKQAAAEAQAAGEAKRANDMRVRQAFANQPKIDVEDMASPDYAQQMKEQIKYALNSGEPDLIEAGQKSIAQLKNLSETSRNDPTTMEGERHEVKVEAEKSQTQLNRSMISMNTTEATKQDMQWAQAYVHQNDPGRQGWNSWRPNYSPEERVLAANALAAILDQIKRDYAQQNGGQQMPTGIAQQQAIAEWNQYMAQRDGGASPPQQNGQGTPPQAPAQAAPAPSTTGGEGSIDFDWSK